MENIAKSWCIPTTTLFKENILKLRLCVVFANVQKVAVPNVLNQTNKKIL